MNNQLSQKDWTQVKELATRVLSDPDEVAKAERTKTKYISSATASQLADAAVQTKDIDLAQSVANVVTHSCSRAVDKAKTSKVRGKTTTTGIKAWTDAMKLREAVQSLEDAAIAGVLA